MSSVKHMFSPPKPKRDKEAERLLAERTKAERDRADAADRALMSSRRARMAGGRGGRTGLAYVSPTAGPSSNLGGG